MKIKQKKEMLTRFSRLNVGEIFLYNRVPYMKIKPVHTPICCGCHRESYVDCVNLETGVAERFCSKAYIVWLDNAKLDY